MRQLLIATVLTTCIGCLLLFPARACTIDGKPTAYANGVRAVLSVTAPTPATYAWWAHFTFPGSFRSHQRVLFREDDAQIRRVLRPSAVRRPWRWRFGDGDTAIGNRTEHAFGRAGHYRVAVDAWFPGYGWQPFDTITIAVRR